MKQKTYIAIDLKSFYASVECQERGLDPLDTNLLVADETRTDKTICLAVSPSLKNYGISGRARLFEAKQRINEANLGRKHDAPNHRFQGKSYSYSQLQSDPSLEIDYIVAPPRMAYYIKYSTMIYQVYTKYIAHEDIIVYSIDEVFIDATNYLDTYKLSAEELAMRIILDVLQTTGITATVGIGTNLYLCKIAMDIVAKHIPADENGVRIARLDEIEYRKKLWTHQPITDFWRVGKGYAKKLEQNGMFTMGDIARCSIENENLLYKLFGKNAELLIDHAWGWENCTIKDIKKYTPSAKSLGSGQVLFRPYMAEEARVVLKEMAASLALSLCDKNLLTNQIVLYIGYDIENINNPELRKNYTGEIVKDSYGRSVPKHSKGTYNLGDYTSSSLELTHAASELFTSIVDNNLLIRRINITATRIIATNEYKENKSAVQLDFFTNYNVLDSKEKQRKNYIEREQKLQKAAIDIKKRFGKNAIIKAISLEEVATAKDRNSQIGGHKA